MNFTNFDGAKKTVAFLPAALTTAAGATTGTAIDCLGFQDVEFDCVANNGASGVVTFAVFEDTAAAFNVDPTAITGATIAVTEAAEGSVATIRIHLAKRKRYLRVTATATVANAVAIASTATLLNPYGTQHKPVTQGIAPVSVNT